MAEAALVEDGEGYDVEFIDENVSKDKIICSICLYTLREPMQAVPCGHRFCKSCIEKVEQQQKENGQNSLHCPNDRTQIQIFPDIGKKREILDFHVKCPNIPNGCTWNDELRYYDDHLEKCLFQRLTCEKRCGKGTLRKEMKHHLDYECPKNLQSCKYAIVGCAFKGHVDAIEQHLKESLDDHVFLQTTNQIRENLDLKEKHQESQKQNKEKVQELEKRVQHQNEKIQELEEKTENQNEIIAQYKQNIAELQDKLNLFGNLFQRCPYTFTVKEVPEYFKVCKNTYMSSEGFYFLNGYRGKLHISFNYGVYGDRVYIGLKIIKGRFDNYLRWPMLFGKVILKIFINGKCWYERSFNCNNDREYLIKKYGKPDDDGDESKRGFWGFDKQRTKSFATDEFEFFVDVERI